MTDEYANWSARDRTPADGEQGLREALSDPQPRCRNAALALVDEAGNGLADETVSALWAVVRGAEDAETRQFAVEALGVAGEGRPAIVAALSDDQEWVRAEAVVALSRTEPGATDRLARVLDEDDSGWVRRNALVALAKLGAADEETCVECIKQDPHPAVREYGAQYLPGEETDRCVRILAAVLAREPNAFVRVKAAERLGELATERAQEALERVGLGDASDDVRRTAKLALARARGVDPESLDVDEVPAPGTGPDGPRQRQSGPMPEDGRASYRQGGSRDRPADVPDGSRPAPGLPPQDTPER